MGIGEIFWILMILWIVFGWWGNFTEPGRAYYGRGSWLLILVLLFLLGWHDFGFIIRGQ